MIEWKDNQYWNIKKIPKEANQFRKVDVLSESGIIYEDCSPILVFLGMETFIKWRPSLSNFQEELDL